MSYDLMVFAKEKAPKTRVDFMAWYEQQTGWNEAHNYDDPAITTVPLRSWFLEIIKTFPQMNGPYAPTEDQIKNDTKMESRLTDYSIGQDIIYAAFAWSQEEKAYRLSRELAKKHGIGFFDVSGDGDVIFPDGTIIE